jgi:hypothetical protein
LSSPASTFSDEARAGLRDDLHFAGVLLEQRREARALERADRREHADDAAARGADGGLTAGSIAMIGSVKRARSGAAAAAVAVLHAITTAAAP